MRIHLKIRFGLGLGGTLRLRLLGHINLIPVQYLTYPKLMATYCLQARHYHWNKFKHRTLDSIRNYQYSFIYYIKLFSAKCVQPLNSQIVDITISPQRSFSWGLLLTSSLRCSSERVDNLLVKFITSLLLFIIDLSLCLSHVYE
jgi:hypothetical protein